MREKLSPRRLGITERLTFRPGVPGEVTFDVTFGYELGGPVKEAFTLAFKLGSDYQDLMHQACIALSIALQSGQSMSDIARVMGESDPAQPPHSMIGLVVRAGVVLDDWLMAQHALVRGPTPTTPEIPPLDPETIFDPTNDDELDEGISSSDLAEEDGGTLVAMAECPRALAKQIPVPATEAAAAARVETNEAKRGATVVAFHPGGAEAGEKHSAPEPMPQTSDAGVTSRERPAPEFEIPAFLRRYPAAPEARP
jgi:hypothetical protein